MPLIKSATIAMKNRPPKKTNRRLGRTNPSIIKRNAKTAQARAAL
jgi:hypothetical protein